VVLSSVLVCSLVSVLMNMQSGCVLSRNFMVCQILCLARLLGDLCFTITVL
jgi:hypothetical protein